MEWLFWLGLVLGAALGIPASIIGNLLTNPITRILGARRVTISEKRKARELRDFKRVTAMVQGGEDRYLHVLRQLASCILLIGSAGIMATIAATFTIDYMNHIGTPTGPRTATALFILLMLMSIGVTMILADSIFKQTLRDIDRLNRYAEYRAEVIEKFGEEPVAVN